jgi:signal transduction histidine kinase
VILNPLGWSVFAAVFLFLFVGGQVRLLIKVPLARGAERTQLVVIATTVIIVGICGMFFNLLLPSPFLEDFRYIWTGPLFTFVFAAVMTYAIFRYRLFNARAAVSELLVFALVLVLFIRVLLAGSFGERWLDASVLAVASVLGALLIGSVNRDIRQRELIEKQKEAIERASAEKSEFMSFASHEIRNPVTAIRGYASLMLEGNMGALDPTVRDTIGKISTLSEDVLKLIARYLAKSKAELGQLSGRTRAKFSKAPVSASKACTNEWAMVP